MILDSIHSPIAEIPDGPSLVESLAYFLKLGALGFGGTIALAGHNAEGPF